MKLILVVAHDPNLIIGKDGELPWHYPEDLKHFKETTMGHPILMGRVVFEELNEKPLKGRENIVLSRSKSYNHVPCFNSIETAFEYLKDREKVFVIGGGEIYRQLISKADGIVATQIQNEYEGDTHFPEYRDKIGTVWEETDRTDHQDFSIVTYERVKH